ITGNKGGTGKTTIAALLAEYLTYQKKKEEGRLVSSRFPVDYQIIDTAGVSGGSETYLKQADIMLVPFIPHYVDLQTKEQQEGLVQLKDETERDMEIGVILPPLSHRPALYGSVLNGSKENFFTKKESEPAKQDYTYSSLSELIRKSLQAYQKGEIDINLAERDKHAPKREITIRFINTDLLNYYYSLPYTQRTAIIEESLATYLDKLNAKELEKCGEEYVEETAYSYARSMKEINEHYTYCGGIQSQRRQNLTIIVEPSTFQRLKKEIGDGKISRFVEKAIIKELNDYSGRIEEKQKEFQQKLIAGYKSNNWQNQYNDYSVVAPLTSEEEELEHVEPFEVLIETNQENGLDEKSKILLHRLLAIDKEERLIERIGQLQRLNISNTDINSGYEHLPASVKYIYSSSEKRPTNFGLQPNDYGFACYLTKQGQNYPKKERSKVEKIYLTEPSLEGELDLGDFTYEFFSSGVKVYISPQLDETKLIFKNKPKGAEIIFLDAQRYINYLCPTKEQREKVTVLNISQKNLEGHLDLSDFINLKVLNCYDNKLTNLTLPNNPTNLKVLNLRGNNFSSDLSFLTGAVNLEELNLSNNKFTGSLEPLKDFLKDLIKLEELHISDNQLTGSLDYLSNLKQLKKLDISNTDLNEVNIDKLPRSLKKIKYYAESWERQRPDCKLITIVPQLEKHFGKFGRCLKCLRLNTKLEIEKDEQGQPKLLAQGDPDKNYLMVMDYMKGGNLRQYLQNNNKGLSLEDKIWRLSMITNGLKKIHDQNLVHRDFHSGNIVGDSITDLGLCQPVNYQKQVGQIFGVMPYIAPEVLQGQPYTQKSDIYSFGIIAYELLAQAYPYADKNLTDTGLALAVCNGLRPNLDKVLIPQLLKDLIKRC
ncbi:137_t:CDS:10, partial [Ambispora leptoticha]